MTNSNPLKTIDVSHVNEKTAKELLDAAQTQGFLFVDGHDFTQNEVDAVFALSRGFFKLPIDEKLKYPMDFDDCGYTYYGQEKLDSVTGDPKEAFNFGRLNFVTGQANNDSLPQIFETNQELYQSVIRKFYQLAMTVLKLLAIGLEIDEAEGGSEWFKNRHRPNTNQITAMRFLHYPSNKSLSPETTVRAGAHTDYGTITLLFQQRNEEGLELFSETKQKWEMVPYIESPNIEYREQGKAAPIVVNIADMLSYWTGGLLKSTKHRVVLPQDLNDRYSIVFFLSSEDEVLLTPIPSKLVSNKIGILNKEGKVMTSREYLTERFAATYMEGH